jgi:RNA recognition motif-containing protein
MRQGLRSLTICPQRQCRSKGSGARQFTRAHPSGIPWKTEAEGLRRHFKKHGKVREAVVIYDKLSGRSKGYGCISYWSPEAAIRAIAEVNPIIEGRKSCVNVAYPLRANPDQIMNSMPQFQRGHWA